MNWVVDLDTKDCQYTLKQDIKYRLVRSNNNDDKSTI